MIANCRRRCGSTSLSFFRAFVVVGALSAAGACQTSAPKPVAKKDDKPPPRDRDDIYTTLNQKTRPGRLAMLKRARDGLDQHNLFDTNKPDAETTCPKDATRFRMPDGRCNHLDAPSMGSAGMRFGRNMTFDAAKKESAHDIMDPNPRAVSQKLLARQDFQPIPHLNLLMASWIQFQNHDWMFHGLGDPGHMHHVPSVVGDAVYEGGMAVQSSSPDTTRSDDERALPPTFRNHVTHWWDASQLYGSSRDAQMALRTGEGGLLKLVDGRLPLTDDRRVEHTGFNENWWVGLSLLHTLFAQEHNAIAAHLAASHPDWSDEELFQVARLVNAAVIAKIHTVEWTPAVLAHPTLKRAMDVNWYGLLDATFNIDTHMGGPVVSGLVGGKTLLHDVPFTITEEFTAVYRMHPFLPEKLALSKPNGAPVATVGLEETRNHHAAKLIDAHTMETMFFSLGRQNAGALVLHNHPKFMQHIEVPVGPQREGRKMDLAAVDVLRDRERGVPRYNEFRRQLRLEPIRTFDELTPDAAVAQELRDVYGDVEKLDLMVGCLAEGVRPDGFGFGETQFHIFILMASRRLSADRFYTTDYRPEVYTDEGLAWIKDATFKSVLLRHYPSLAPNVDGLPTGFEPWVAK